MERAHRLRFPPRGLPTLPTRPPPHPAIRGWFPKKAASGQLRIRGYTEVGKSFPKASSFHVTAESGWKASGRASSASSPRCRCSAPPPACGTCALVVGVSTCSLQLLHVPTPWSHMEQRAVRAAALSWRRAQHACARAARSPCASRPWTCVSSLPAEPTCRAGSAGSSLRATNSSSSNGGVCVNSNSPLHSTRTR